MHILDLSLAGIGHKLGISLVMGIFWDFFAYNGHIADISLVYVGHILGIS